MTEREAETLKLLKEWRRTRKTVGREILWFRMLRELDMLLKEERDSHVRREDDNDA